MIAINQLSFRFPHSGFSLAIPSLEVARGGHVAIVGPSGTGKTTLLHLMAGILLPTSGSIRVMDQDLGAMGESARRSFRMTRMGLVFQNFELISYLSVWENILLPCRLNPALRLSVELRERARQLAETAGLSHRLHQFPERISHGEKQRVTVCRAMLTQPGLILADEPTSHLDPANKRQIMDLLLQQADQNGATLLLVSHDDDIVGEFSRLINCRDFARED